MKNPSPYASCPGLSAGKLFRLRATDFLVGFFSSLLFSLLCLQVTTHLPAYQNANDRLSESRNDLSSLLVSAHLGERNENGTTKSEAELTREYVYSLTKGSLLHYGEDEKAGSSFYENIEPASSTNDALFQYYVSFKPANEASFLAIGESGAAAYQDLLKSSVVESYYEDGEYPYLTLSSSLALDQLFRMDEKGDGETIRAAIYANYLDLWNKSTQEFRKNYVPYIKEAKVFDSRYANLAAQVTLILYLGTAIGLFLTEWILPLFFHRRATLPGFFQSAYHVDKEGNDPGFGNLSARFALSLIKIPLLAFLASFALLQLSAFEILASASLGAFPLWIFLILSVVYLVAEWVPLLLKKNLTLSLLVSRTQIKDGKDLEKKEAEEKAESE